MRKLVLVANGPFEQEYVGRIQATRLGRLSEDEQAEYESIIKTLDDPGAEGKDTAFARLGALASKTDEYDPTDLEPEESGMGGKQDNRFHNVLKEAQELRRTGKLLQFASQIQCPVVAVHGDYDPHPAE